MRGTVRMTARSVRPSRTGARVMTTHAPIVLVALADARVESFALGASVALVLNAHSRLRWGDGSEGALHRLWADGGGGAVHHGEMGRGYASTGQLSSDRVAPKKLVCTACMASALSARRCFVRGRQPALTILTTSRPDSATHASTGRLRVPCKSTTSSERSSEPRLRTVRSPLARAASRPRPEFAMPIGSASTKLVGPMHSTKRASLRTNCAVLTTPMACSTSTPRWRESSVGCRRPTICG